MRYSYKKIMPCIMIMILISTMYMGEIKTELNFNSSLKYSQANINYDENPMGVVVIDDLHNNDYTSGDMNIIKTELEELGYIVFYSSEFENFEESVEAANYLVISAIFESFSLEEKNSIKEWFEGGSKNLIIASRGDFSQPYYDSMNDLLDNLGASMKTQDDNVYTTDNGVSQPWYIDSDNFNIDEYPEIFDGVNTIGFFSPSSINPGNGDVLVYAEKEAYQSNENGDPAEIIFDDTNDGNGGDSIPLAVYEEIDSGDLRDRIIAVGTTLWSDFDYGAPSFGDIDFFNNMLKYMREKTIEEAGVIDLNVEDNIAPTIEIKNPRNGSYVKGDVKIEIDAFDAFGVKGYKLFINNIEVSNNSDYLWETTNIQDGIYTLTAEAYDATGNKASITNKYYVVQSFEPFLEADPKIMTYNIKESGIYDPWIDVMKEENADIAMLVETGDFDDDNNEKLKQVINELNEYFFDEVDYQGYTLQNINNPWNGITILSRYDISSNEKLNNLDDDNGNNVFIPLPFLHSEIKIGDEKINLIGAHLSCCSGQSNWDERYAQQESLLNYLDDLGDEPIIYLGDFNALSPDDVDPNEQNPSSDLGTEPIEMVLNSNHPSASKIHEFIDVAQEMGTKDITFIGCCESRIDYIFVNQFFNDLILDSTTGDTKSALFGSDHTSVDVNINFTDLISEPEFNLEEITEYQSTDSTVTTTSVSSNETENLTSSELMSITENSTLLSSIQSDVEEAGIRVLSMILMINLFLIVNFRRKINLHNR